MNGIDWGKEKKPYRERVLDLLWDLNWHTNKELGQVGGNRYSARILELKRLGFAIETKDLDGGLQGKSYRLVTQVKGQPQQKKIKIFLTEEEVRQILRGGYPLERTRKTLISALVSYHKNKKKL